MLLLPQVSHCPLNSPYIPYPIPLHLKRLFQNYTTSRHFRQLGLSGRYKQQCADMPHIGMTGCKALNMPQNNNRDRPYANYSLSQTSQKKTEKRRNPLIVQGIPPFLCQ